MTPAQVAHIMALLDQYVRACKGVTNYENVMAAKAVRDKLEAALRDAPQQAEGWVMVPMEPTEAMDLAYLEGAKLHAAEGSGDRMRFSWGGYRAMLAATPSAPTAVEPDERTPQDYAIEHAEYMAQSAEHLIAAVNDLALAEQQCEDGEANPSDVDAARESVTESQGNLKSSIYEFRKRRDRASKGTP